jgi:hypothetical protein
LDEAKCQVEIPDVIQFNVQFFQTEWKEFVWKGSCPGLEGAIAHLTSPAKTSQSLKCGHRVHALLRICQDEPLSDT